MRVIWTTSTVSRCSIRTRSMSSPGVGASTVTVMQRTNLSQVICVSPSEPPSATAAMVCRFRKIISEGNIGLMQALNRFDPERGFALPLCGVVDQGFDTGLRSAIVVACENRRYRKPEEAFLHAGLGETQDLCPRRRRPTSRSGNFDREKP